MIHSNLQFPLFHERTRHRLLFLSDAPRGVARHHAGALRIMQELYDDMIPGITDTQGGYAQRIADQLEDVVDVTFQEPARNRQDIERQMWAFNEEGLDGVLLVMLTYSPAMRTVRALSENELPVMLANVQPERRITKEWDMDDLTRGPACFGLLAIVYGRKGNDERFDPTYEKRLKERQAEKKSTDDASSAQNEEQSFNTLYTTALYGQCQVRLR